MANQKTSRKKVESKKQVQNKKKENIKKQPKTNKKVQKKNNTDEITKLVEVVPVLLVVFAVFYIITYWVQKSKTKIDTNEVEENVIIQYDEILIGRLFEQNKSEYYVLIIDENDTNDYTTYLSSYKEKEGALRFYTAKIGNAFNKKYKSDTSSLNVQNIKELKVKDTTLLKIKEKKIEESFEGKTKVIEKLGSLIK